MRYGFCTLAVGLISVGLVADPPAGRAAPPAVAVTAVDSTKVDPATLDALIKSAQGGLAAAGVSVVSRAKVKELLAGKAALLECKTSGCLKQIGQATKAQLLAMLTLRFDGSNYDLKITVTEAASGKLIASREKSCDICNPKEAGEALFKEAQQAGKKIKETYQSGGPPPVRRRRGVTPPPGGKGKTPDRGKTLRLVGYVLLGVGLAVVAPGAAMLAIDGNDAGGGPPSSNRKIYDTATLGIALTAVGAAVVVTSAVLMGLGFAKKKEKAGAVSFGVGAGPDGAVVVGKVRF